MKALIYLPTIILNTLSLVLPRWIFIPLYRPQSDGVRQAELQVRNAIRITDYYAKRALLPRRNK